MAVFFPAGAGQTAAPSSLIAYSPLAETVGAPSLDNNGYDPIIAGFKSSGLGPFLSVYHEAAKAKPRQLVVYCKPSTFGMGIADRIYGLPYALSLAILTDRQFVIHPSLLSESLPLDQDMDGGLYFNKSHVLTDTWRVITDDQPTIYLMSNAFFDVTHVIRQLRSAGELFDHHPALHPDDAKIASLKTIRNSCFKTPYLRMMCGAAVIHSVEAFKEGIMRAKHIVEAMSTLPKRNYTALHLRCGGSELRLEDGHPLEAISWHDEYSTAIPQMWIDAFRRSSFSDCQLPLSVLSDSVRAVAEVEHAVADRIMISHCCSQPLHRGKRDYLR